MCDHRHLQSPTPASIVDHVTSVSNNLGELVYNTEYSDITLVVEDVRFQSHKVILAARSDYFRYKYCEIIINRGILIFADFVVHLNQENKNRAKYNFPVDCCL
jgi:hypothetical protein